MAGTGVVIPVGVKRNGMNLNTLAKRPATMSRMTTTTTSTPVSRQTPSTTTNVGVGYYTVCSLKNKREYMEDRYAVLTRGQFVTAMVCDGHGGSNVAEVLAANVPFIAIGVLEQHTRIGSTELKTANAVSHAIHRYCKSILDRRVGSTLSGFVSNGVVVYMFNIGDSRTCFHFKRRGGGVVHYLGDVDRSGQSTVLTTATTCSNTVSTNHPSRTHKVDAMYWNTIDHVPANSSEHERVVNEGGAIRYGRLNGVLAMTRSVGDHDIGPGLSSLPTVSWVNRASICPTLLLYSDGLVEDTRLVPHQVYHYAIEHGVEAVVNKAIESGSQDNITALLVSI